MSWWNPFWTCVFSISSRWANTKANPINFFSRRTIGMFITCRGACITGAFEAENGFFACPRWHTVHCSSTLVTRYILRNRSLHDHPLPVTWTIGRNSTVYWTTWAVLDLAFPTATELVGDDTTILTDSDLTIQYSSSVCVTWLYWLELRTSSRKPESQHFTDVRTEL